MTYPSHHLDRVRAYNVAYYRANRDAIRAKTKRYAEQKDFDEWKASLCR
jgi:hypothetical protein